MVTPAHDAVKRPVERFDLSRKVFLSGDCKEEQLRFKFLNPFFTVLGWDMDYRQGLSETDKKALPEGVAGWSGQAEGGEGRPQVTGAD